MAQKENFDLIIIGAGPTGLNVAIEAEKAGLSYTIIEKGVLVNSIYNFPANMTFFSTSPVLEIGGVPFISHGDKPTRNEALEYYRRIVQSYKLKIRLQEEVKSVEKEDGGFAITTSKHLYRSKYLVVCTGYFDNPRMLDVEGEDLPKVKHYYDDAHVYVGMDVVVVGAANSACDVALECFYKGANVTMVVRKSELYPKVKYWIRPNIENRIKEGSIKAFFDSTIDRVYADSVIINTPNGKVGLKNDYVLAMTGYLPDYSFLKSLGLEIIESDECIPSYNPDTLESNVPNLYVAGVICAGNKTSRLFIENTRDHGGLIINDILDKDN